MRINRRRQWKQLYLSLCTTASKYGRPDAFGEGDYWIVDDDYGGWEQKVILTNIRMLRTTMIFEFLDLIKHRYRLWSVVIAIELPEGCAAPPMGLVVRADGIEDALVKSALPPDIAAIDFNGGGFNQ